MQHGLGNRLRAYLSAAEVAHRSNRSLTLVWVPDEHCNATFQSLFQRKEHEDVRDAPFAPSAAVMYDYMNVNPRPIIHTARHPGEDIVVRSAYLLVSDVVDTPLDSASLRRARDLVVSPAVQNEIPHGVCGRAHPRGGQLESRHAWRAALHQGRRVEDSWLTALGARVGRSRQPRCL